LRSGSMSKIGRDPLYRRHRFSAEMISHAVWLYFRFPLSLRMVEDMLAARGIIVTHQTIRNRAEKFGRHFANDVRRRSTGRLGDKWYLDENDTVIDFLPYRIAEGWKIDLLTSTFPGLRYTTPRLEDICNIL
jgi:hypothetical protein